MSSLGFFPFFLRIWLSDTVADSFLGLSFLLLLKDTQCWDMPSFFLLMELWESPLWSKILFYTSQTLLSLAFCLDLFKVRETNDVFLEQSDSKNAQRYNLKLFFSLQIVYVCKQQWLSLWARFLFPLEWFIGQIRGLGWKWLKKHQRETLKDLEKAWRTFQLRLLEKLQSGSLEAKYFKMSGGSRLLHRTLFINWWMVQLQFCFLSLNI